MELFIFKQAEIHCLKSHTKFLKENFFFTNLPRISDFKKVHD